MNWLSILGLCLIVLGTVFSFFGTYKSNERSQSELTTKIQEKNNTIDTINESNVKLIGQNSSLLTSNSDVTNTNKSLITQNKDMLDKIGKYQSDIEERDSTIEQLKDAITNIKEYSYYATLDIYGIGHMKPGYGIIVTSDLSTRMHEILTEKNGVIFVKNDKSLVPKIDEVIQLYPYFPFGYWVKFNLLKELGNNDWKQYAEQAKNIFEITTTIQGHDPSQDQALKDLNEVLATNH